MQHCLVIGAYFHYSGGWSGARAYDVSPQGPNTNDPFFIVEATKQEGGGNSAGAGGAGADEEWPRIGGSSGYHRMAGRLS